MAENGEVQLAKKLKLDELEETLVYFATSIISKNTEEEVLWDLAKNCISRLGFLDCVIYKVDYDRKVLVQKAAYGPKNPRSYEVLKPIEIPVGKGITGTVAATGKPELIRDTSKDARYVVDDEVRLSEIAVPITQDDKVWGVIDCEHPDKNFFTHQHLKTLHAIASICAVKLARVNAEQELKLKQKALMDTERELVNLRVNSLRRQMNPHFLFNALNAIQYFITTDKKKMALRYHSLFSKLIRKYMLHLDEEKIQLEEEIRMINWYLKLQQLRYEDRFQFAINVPESLYNLPIPTLIIQLIVEELIERMVMSNSGEGCLTLDFTRNADKLLFKASLEVDMLLGFTRNDPNDYRANLFTWQEHIDLLNKLKDLKIIRQIDELRNDKGEITGRTIALTIPVPE